MSTYVSMKPKPKESKNPEFVGKVSAYGEGRKHIEVPKDKRDKFESGDDVFVEKLKINR